MNFAQQLQQPSPNLGGPPLKGLVRTVKLGAFSFFLGIQVQKNVQTSFMELIWFQRDISCG